MLFRRLAIAGAQRVAAMPRGMARTSGLRGV